MVSFDSSIAVDHHTDMPNKSVHSPKQINHLVLKNKRPPFACERSHYAAIDVIIFIAVIGSSGFLLYPGFAFLAQKTLEFGQEFLDVMAEEISQAPLLFGCLGLCIIFSTAALITIAVYTDRDCGRRGCRGLRRHAEFDIRVEGDGCVKKSTYLAKSAILENGFSDLPRDYYRELEADLRKLAPVNGRAVLVFRAKCGCCVGKMEAVGPRKARKVKK